MTLRSDIILVGLGRWGANIHRTLQSKGLCTITVDPVIGCGAEYTTLSTALLHHSKLAVIIATPPHTHFPLAKEALQAGRYVLVEKPMCVSVEEAEELSELSEGRLMVDHLLMHSSPHRRLLRLCKDGVIGRLRRVKMTRFNFGTVRKHENVLWSLLAHDVSLLLGLFTGAVKDVRCVGQAVVTEGVEDYVDVSVRFDDGCIGQVEGAWMHPYKERRAVVYGESGCLVLNEWFHSEKGVEKGGLRWYKWSATTREAGVDIEKKEMPLPEMDEETAGLHKEALRNVIEHFWRCSQGLERISSDADAGLGVVRVLSAATQSLKSNGIATQVARRPCTADNGAYIHPSATVDSGAMVGAGCKVWHYSHLMGTCTVGSNVSIGQNVFIGASVRIGSGCKIQNNVSVYGGVTVEEEVFLGPHCAFTNVKRPRAFTKGVLEGTVVRRGATVGANATVVCGVTLGEYCLVGAGSVVTRDVERFAVVVGNPARRVGWVGKDGGEVVREGGEVVREGGGGIV